MEGFIEHLIVRNTKFEKELGRDVLGIEIPYMKSVFKRWLKNQNNVDSTVNTYISKLNSIDSHIDMSLSYDMFIEIAHAVENGNQKVLDKIFLNVNKVLSDWKDFALEYGEMKSENTYINYVSTLRKYHEFLSYIINNENYSKEVFPIELSPLYKEKDFEEWLGRKVESYTTPGQYLSNIRRLRKQLFSKLTYLTLDPMALLERCVSNEPEKALLLLQKLEKRTEEEYSNPKILKDLDINVLKNCKSAFDIYVTFVTPFIKEKINNNNAEK